jgi:hypothetical protein
MRERAPLLPPLRLIAAALALAVVAPASAQAPEGGWFMNHWGFLQDEEGHPVNGAVGLTFRLYAQAAPEEGEQPLWTSEALWVYSFIGLYSVRLGPLPEDPFDGRSAVFMSVTPAGNSELLPRERLGGALLAQRAHAADAVIGESHCDCQKIEVGEAGLHACPAGRAAAGIFRECSGGGEACVSAMNCCRVCE